MKLFTLGVNHETAPIDIREKVSFTAESIQHAIADLKQKSLIKECIILSTCNRTEIYGVASQPKLDKILIWLHQYFELKHDSLTPYLYEHKEHEAVKHIMRVSTGLNSLVLGEPQILGQIKDAYNAGHKADSIHHTLENLFQQIFKTAKQVRTDTRIGSSPVSVAFSAVSLSKQFFGDFSQQTALLLGAGETIKLVARHLKENNIGKLIIANRTLSKAHKLAETLGGYAIELHEIPEHLHEADIIIGSTASPTPILLKSHIKKALKKRRQSPMFIVDIAIPRDIEASVGEFNNAYLYTVDDLKEIIDENKLSRQNAALEADKIICVQAEAFCTQYKSIQQVNPLIQTYRQDAYQLKDNAIQEALHHLEKGDSPEQVIIKLANQLTNRLLHTSTAHLHQAGIEGNESLIKAAKEILLPDRCRR